MFTETWLVHCRAAETTVLIAETAQAGKLLFLLSSAEGLQEAPQRGLR